MHSDLKHQRMHVHKSHVSTDSAHVAYATYMYVPPCIDGQPLVVLHLDFKPSIHMHLENGAVVSTDAKKLELNLLGTSVGAAAALRRCLEKT